MNLLPRHARIFSGHLNVKSRRIIAAVRLLKTHNLKGLADPLVINVQRLNVGQGNLTAKRVRRRVQPRRAAINVKRRRLNIGIGILRRSHKLRGVLRLHLTPNAAGLVITRYHK